MGCGAVKQGAGGVAILLITQIQIGLSHALWFWIRKFWPSEWVCNFGPATDDIHDAS